MCGPGFSVGSRSQLIASCPRAMKASRTVPLNSQPIRTLKKLTSYVFRASVQRQSWGVSQSPCALREELGFLLCGIPLVCQLTATLLPAEMSLMRLSCEVGCTAIAGTLDHLTRAVPRPVTTGQRTTSLLGMRRLKRRAAGRSLASAVEDTALHEAVATIDRAFRLLRETVGTDAWSRA